MASSLSSVVEYLFEIFQSIWLQVPQHVVIIFFCIYESCWSPILLFHHLNPIPFFNESFVQIYARLWDCCIINGAGKTGKLHEKNESRTLTPYTKINPKYIKDLNIRPYTIKLLEENIGRTPFNINHNNILFDPPSRIRTIKTKISQWDLIKLKSFCTAKETINKRRDKPQNWRKSLQTMQQTRA